MARIRTIKPEFWSNEDLSEVSETAALFAIAILNFCDDGGYFNANEKLLKSQIFPIRDQSVTIQGILTELSSRGYLVLFLGADGRRYGKVVKFAEHQVINRPKPSKIQQLEPCQGSISDQSVTDHIRERKGKEDISLSKGARGNNRFSITQDYRPDERFYDRLAIASIPIPTEKQMAEILQEFRSFWGESSGKKLSQSQWDHKLTFSVKKYLEASSGSNRRKNSKQSHGAASAVDAVKQRNQQRDEQREGRVIDITERQTQ